jgi:NAD(P)-dependent dehydrogenase (short-subunit alcohol dehydrogenase family)
MKSNVSDHLVELGSLLDLTGRVALVTGGSGGIGEAIVANLLKAGAKVVVADLRLEMRSGAAEPLFIETDVIDENSVRKCSLEVLDKYGRIDILVNNAGIMYKDFIDDLDMGRWRKLLEVNLTGPTICTKIIAPIMKHQKWGRIINTSSVQAYLATPKYSAYTASKAALSQLTKVWATELAPFHITVNALCPSYVRTPMMEKTIKTTQETKQITREEAIALLVEPILQKRLLEPDEIAFWVTVLCSEQAKGLTGADIAVSGGWVLH